MADGTRDADDDVIAAGREPRGRAPRPAGLAWLLAAALAAALAVVTAAAVHYRAEAGQHRRPGPPAAGPPAAGPPVSALPEVTSAALRLPAGEGVAATVVITAAALPGAGRAQFTVSAVITGGVPGTVYDLIGSDCSDAGPVPDEVWATGKAGPDGTADLAGYAWTGAVADRYWMALDPSPASPAPGLHGQFAAARAAPFAAGQPPCPVPPRRPAGSA